VPPSACEGTWSQEQAANQAQTKPNGGKEKACVFAQKATGYGISYSTSIDVHFAMLIGQGFQYAARLKAQRQALVRRWVGCRRFVFNEALTYQRAELAAGRKRPGYAALCQRLPELRKAHPWLAQPPAQALQPALKMAWTPPPFGVGRPGDRQ
jgi:putative transposase